MKNKLISFFLIFTPLAILLGSGCQNSQTSNSSKPAPFVFRSLDLSHKHSNGDRDWDLKSPKASYEITRRQIRAKKPTGILYKDNKPYFSISAQQATVINDGELILLEGNVKLTQLRGQEVLITGNQLLWTPQTALMVIEKQPKAFNKDSRIVAKQVKYNQNTQELEFKGPSQLDRWNGKRNSNQNINTTIKTNDGSWNLETGVLIANGPIIGEHKEEANGPIQKLSASKLKGNLKKGYLDIISPVVVKVPDKKGFLTADTTRWFFNKEYLTSSKPFNATMEKSSLTGNGFEANLKTSTVLIKNNCIYNQPGESLTANRCLWNWQSNEVEAIGNVILERDDNQQITRSSIMNGRMGQDGEVKFSSPGAKVMSEVYIEDSKVKTNKPKAKRSPVNF